MPASRPFPRVLTVAAAATALVGGIACGDAGGEAPAEAFEQDGPPPDAEMPVLPLVEADDCREGAYLCAGLALRDGRALRWASETPVVRVSVPLPAVEPRSLARALQDAAVAGFLAWQEKPFPLQVTRTGDAGADIIVQWEERLEGAELGRAETRWTRDADGTASMRVTRFALAIRNPLDPSRLLLPREVQITAAHEMGHALGLPHSDSPRDVMYPTNTATALSPQDYRAMAALYRIANGARLPDGLPDSGGQSSR